MGNVVPSATSAAAFPNNTDDPTLVSRAKSARIRADYKVSPECNLRRHFVPSSRGTLIGLDLVLMAGGMAAMIYAIHARLGFSGSMDAMAAAFTIVTCAMAFSYAAGCYRHDALVDFSAATTRLTVGLAASALFLAFALHFGFERIFTALAFKSASRVVTVVLLASGAGLCGGMTSRALMLAMARRHWFRRTILIIGTGARARHIRDLFERTDRRLAEVHFVTEAYLGGKLPPDLSGRPITPIRGVTSMEELEQRFHIDQVVVAVDDPHGLSYDRLLPWKANGIPVFDFNSFLERETGRVDLRWTDSDWLLYCDGFHFGYLDQGLKRALDVFVSASLLLITLPTLLIVSLAIVMDDYGPVFYSQERVSHRGRHFRILKFRTMRVDAEKAGAQWATERDPRVTRMGHFLRRSRIDEVPQLLNVLRGDMSLVGPRPERPVFIDQLSEQIRLYHLRHSVKAGVTGWAQINYPYGASIEDAERKLEYDLYYLKHFSVLRDIGIMLETFRVLVFAKGGR